MQIEMSRVTIDAMVLDNEPLELPKELIEEIENELNEYATAWIRHAEYAFSHLGMQSSLKIMVQFMDIFKTGTLDFVVMRLRSELGEKLDGKELEITLNNNGLSKNLSVSIMKNGLMNTFPSMKKLETVLPDFFDDLLDGQINDFFQRHEDKLAEAEK